MTTHLTLEEAINVARNAPVERAKHTEINKQTYNSHTKINQETYKSYTTVNGVWLKVELVQRKEHIVLPTAVYEQDTFNWLNNIFDFALDRLLCGDLYRESRRSELPIMRGPFTTLSITTDNDIVVAQYTQSRPESTRETSLSQLFDEYFSRAEQKPAWKQQEDTVAKIRQGLNEEYLSTGNDDILP